MLQTDGDPRLAHQGGTLQIETTQPPAAPQPRQSSSSNRRKAKGKR